MTLEEALRLQEAWRLLFSVDHHVVNDLAEELSALEAEINGHWVLVLHVDAPSPKS